MTQNIKNIISSFFVSIKNKRAAAKALKKQRIKNAIFFRHYAGEVGAAARRGVNRNCGRSWVNWSKLDGKVKNGL